VTPSCKHPGIFHHVPLVCIALFFLSGGDSFSHKEPFKQQLVVYSVLSTYHDIQFVRVYTNYDVSGFDPFGNRSDTPVTGAQVVIKGPHGSYTHSRTRSFNGQTRAGTSLR